MSEQIRRAAVALREADALLVSAGAGMGVDSGLPDFRGTEGFWRAYPVMAKLGLSFEEMANPAWFQTDPHLAWAFYGHRLNLYRHTNRFRLWVEALQKSRAGFVVVELGAGTAIPTVRITSERLAEKLRGTLIRLNSREATVPDNAIGLSLSALEGMQRLYAALTSLRPPVSGLE